MNNHGHYQETLQPNVELGDLIAKHGRLWAAGFTWQPEPGRTMSFESKYYFTDEDCDRATARILKSEGYQAPKFWQWWRWGEARPNASVQQLLANASAQSSPDQP